MNKIKFYRQQKNMTVKELSEKATVATGYVSDLENNNSVNPSRDIMQKIANALGQTVADVFFPEDGQGGVLDAKSAKVC